MTKKESSAYQTFPCSCEKSPHIVITLRHASWAGAVFIVLFLIGCLLSYSWGQRVALARFNNDVQQQSFADQIYFSLCTRDGALDLPERVAQGDQEETDSDDQSEAITQPLNEQTDASTSLIQDVEKIESVVSIPAHSQKAQEPVQQNYYAQLIGFQSARAAQEFVASLERDGITTKIDRKQSKTHGAKVRTWYQVCTLPLSSEAEIKILVDTIKKIKNIKDVRIVPCLPLSERLNI